MPTRRSRASSLATAGTIKKALGEDYRTVIDDPKSDFAWWIFASRDNKQLFSMRHHAGDAIHSYREFEVKFGRHDKKPMKLPVYEFITGKGIKLGMKRKAVLAKFGPCFKSTRKDENEIVRYEIADESLDRRAQGEQHAAILRRVRIPRRHPRPLQVRPRAGLNRYPGTGSALA